MSLKLRDYQQAFISDIRKALAAGHRRVLGVSPVGSGKTACFSHMCAGTAKNGKRVAILCHRDFLADQISSALQMVRVPHGMLLGGQIGVPSSQVTIASVYTLAKRLKHFRPPHLIICDEAHRVIGGSVFHKCIEAFPDAMVVGVTASPVRLDRRPLREVFSALVEGPSVAELIATGYLSQFEVYAPAKPDLSHIAKRGGDYDVGQLEEAMSKPKITGHAVEQYRRLADGKRAMAFAVSIKHAVDVAKEFSESGIASGVVHGKMDRGEIQYHLHKFKTGATKVLASCMLVGEGFDLPAIECAILLRPTQSLSLFIQQCGRAMRPFPGKDKAIIIDHSGNTARLGFPDDDHEWTLDGGYDPQERGESVPRIQNCPKCFSAHRPRPSCPRCGWVYEIKSREVEHVDGDLVRTVGGVEVTPEEAARKEFERQYAILVNIAKRRSYDNPERWAANIMQAKLAKKLAKEREPDGPTVNGLTADERATIMKAMSKEDAAA